MTASRFWRYPVRYALSVSVHSEQSIFDKYLIPIQEQLFAPSDYLHALPSLRNNDNIDRVDFIPPRIGKHGYGKFRVRYKSPILVEEAQFWWKNERRTGRSAA